MEWLDPSTVTLTDRPSHLRDYGFQPSDHLHIQQARFRWMRGVKAWMTSPSRRWKAVSRLTVRETNFTLETDKNKHPIGRLRNWEGSEGCRYARFFMPLSKPGNDQAQKEAVWCSDKKQKAKARYSGLLHSWSLCNNVPETYPRWN